MKSGTNRRFWMGMAVVATTVAAAPPPPPGGEDGGMTPPDYAPPGKIYFEDNVVIVGSDFQKPKSGGGTVFISIDQITGGLQPGQDTDALVRTVVRQTAQAKSAVESAVAAFPAGLMNPAGLWIRVRNGLEADSVRGQAELLTEEAGVSDPVGRGGGAGDPSGSAIRAGDGTPAPRPPRRSAAGEPVVPSYWQLPIR